MCKSSATSRTCVTVLSRRKQYKLVCEDIKSLWKRPKMKSPRLPHYDEVDSSEDKMTEKNMDGSLSASTSS